MLLLLLWMLEQHQLHQLLQQSPSRAELIMRQDASCPASQKFISRLGSHTPALCQLLSLSSRMLPAGPLAPPADHMGRPPTPICCCYCCCFARQLVGAVLLWRLLAQHAAAWAWRPGHAEQTAAALHQPAASRQCSGASMSLWLVHLQLRVMSKGSD